MAHLLVTNVRLGMHKVMVSWCALKAVSYCDLSARSILEQSVPLDVSQDALSNASSCVSGRPMVMSISTAAVLTRPCGGMGGWEAGRPGFVNHVTGVINKLKKAGAQSVAASVRAHLVSCAYARRYVEHSIKMNDQQTIFCFRSPVDGVNHCYQPRRSLPSLACSGGLRAFRSGPALAPVPELARSGNQTWSLIRRPIDAVARNLAVLPCQPRACVAYTSLMVFDHPNHQVGINATVAAAL